ncbi:hypothetical protein [Arsenicibacter rosenii]|uniref:Uncharacterized protein n=1 Tax=Arsenicibacter rosenii TaxID=1750698 RepID=A0A1S2VM35_9BACT|nr:hypothetical protein [Arsenicibacter rosenii]OIN59822.1 hypothetical protein BLX24_08160 [Arsenicibacter rosenii]
MIALQKLVNLSLSGNRQNEYRLPLYFASGQVPSDLEAEVYFGDDPTPVPSLKPAFILPQTRPDLAILVISGPKMLAASDYSNLYVELSYGGMVQTRGTLTADLRTEQTPRQDFFKLHTFGGDMVYVFLDQIIAQMLGVQDDVNEKLGSVEDIQQDIITRQNVIIGLSEQTADDRQATNQDRQQVASDTQTVGNNLNLTNTYKNSAYSSSVFAKTSEDNAKTSETNAAASALLAQQERIAAQENRYRYMGSWAPNTDYIVGDGVLYGNSFYRRKTAGNSGSTFAKANWDLLAAGVNPRGSWAATTNYLLNDLVVFRRSAYLATSDFTSGSTFNRSNWTRIASGWNPAGAWAATTQYYEDDIVTNTGSSYRVTADHTSGASFSASNLELIAAKGNTGDNAYTSLSAGFTMPAVLGTVSATVGTTAWMAAGIAVYVAGAGYMLVSSVTNATTVVLQNINYVGNAAAAASIASGGTVSPAGRGTPNYVIPAASVNTSLTYDMATDPNLMQEITLTGNVATFNLNGKAFGRVLVLSVIQGGSGNYSITFGSDIKTPGGAAVDFNLTVGGRTMLHFLAISNTEALLTYIKL